MTEEIKEKEGQESRFRRPEITSPSRTDAVGTAGSPPRTAQGCEDPHFLINWYKYTAGVHTERPRKGNLGAS